MKVKQLFEKLSVIELAVTKRELLMMRDHLAKLFKVSQSQVPYHQIAADNRDYLVTYFIVPVVDIMDEDEAAFQAKLAGKSAHALAQKLYGPEAHIDTTAKTINPRIGLSVKVKHIVRVK